MSHEETCPERQKGELEVLKSIYCEDLIDLRIPGPRRGWKPLDVKIKLFPQRGDSGGNENTDSHIEECPMHIYLHVVCPENYPDIAPNISLEDSRGLSDSEVDKLYTELKEICNKHAKRRCVVIHELASHISEFLHRHRKPANKSLHDEMMQRIAREKQKHKLELQQENEQIRLNFEDDALRATETLNTKQRAKNPRLNLPSDVPELENPDFKYICKSPRKRTTSKTIDGLNCNHKGVGLISFTSRGEHQVQRGRCIGHSDRGRITYAGLDLHSGNLVAVTEWKININNENKSIIDYIKNNIETELNSFCKMKRHDNLVNYLNITHIHHENQVTIYLLQEFIIGTNISALFVTKNYSLDIVRHCAVGVLHALDFLHKNNVIHKDLRDTNVFIDKQGDIKVSDYSIDKRIYDLAMGVQGQIRSYSKKKDIFRFGVLMLSLLQGSPVDEKDLRIPSALPSDARDFLSRCILDEHTRFTASQLLQHQFIQRPTERFSPARTLESSPLDAQLASVDSSNDPPEPPEHKDELQLKKWMATCIGTSRLKKEFELLTCLGKGAYGSVFKARNVVDDQYYAVKRIKLNPQNKTENNKILREVKFISSLHHENVVRYFASWMESGTVPTKYDDLDGTMSPESVCTQTRNVLHCENKNDDLTGVVISEELDIGPVKWSICHNSKSAIPDSESISSEDEAESECDEEDIIGTVTDSETEEDSCVLFQTDSTTQPQTSTSPDDEQKDGSSPEAPMLQYMYIQMEFCEKSTLKIAIDNGLYNDKDRIWRLFRDIVEGLSHIHKTGILHRDLKPVNIFLDSNDRVKIGDFGLATTYVLHRANTGLEIVPKEQQNDATLGLGGGDVSMTGQVGTTFYTAPEITNKLKAVYNQKVDIYSLGIILFEMVYRPPKTIMERADILNSLRTKEIIFPEKFLEDKKNSRFRDLIKWLLNHDPSKRPMAQEILHSPHVPPPAIAQHDFQELIQHTLADRSTVTYRYLMSACFNQTLKLADDILYEMSPEKPGRKLNTKELKSDNARRILMAPLLEHVKSVIIKVFKVHGGLCLNTPLLMPKSMFTYNKSDCVKMMTQSGKIVSVPRDLRVSFARYVILRNITSLKRFSIDRVYRDVDPEYAPRELYECAFDIITPSNDLMIEAELLSIVYEICNEFPIFINKNLTICLNHTSLIEAVLLHCNIGKEKHNDIYTMLSGAKDRKFSKSQVQTHLISLCLPKGIMKFLSDIIETEDTISEMEKKLSAVVKNKGVCSRLVKQALNDLKQIITNAENLGVLCNIKVAPGFVHNFEQFSGLMCQVVCDFKKKKKKCKYMIAAGGRYDKMLESFNNMKKKTEDEDIERPTSHGAGISISLDKLVQAVDDEEVTSDDDEVRRSIDVVVCSSGNKTMHEDEASVLRKIWSAGISCALMKPKSFNEIDELIRDMNASCAVVLQSNDRNAVLVKYWEKDRILDKKVATIDLIEYLQKRLRSSSFSANDSSSSITPILVRSESRVAHAESPSAPSVYIRVFIDKTAPAQRRIESIAHTNLKDTFSKFSKHARIAVLVLSVEKEVIGLLASDLVLNNNEDAYQQSVNKLMLSNQKYKKVIKDVCEQIASIYREKHNPVMILYCYENNTNNPYFKILM